MIQKYVKILLVFGMLAVMCGTVSAAGMGIIAETHETSGVSAPVCSAPCECMSLTQAMQRWGADGYDYCSKTVCGQSGNADVQYYCLHQIASPATVVTNVPAQTPATASAAPAQAPAPAAAGVTQKSPGGITTIIAAIGVALLAAAGMRRK